MTHVNCVQIKEQKSSDNTAPMEQVLLTKVRLFYKWYLNYLDREGIGIYTM